MPGHSSCWHEAGMPPRARVALSLCVACVSLLFEMCLMKRGGEKQFFCLALRCGVLNSILTSAWICQMKLEGGCHCVGASGGFSSVLAVIVWCMLRDVSQTNFWWSGTSWTGCSGQEEVWLQFPACTSWWSSDCHCCHWQSPLLNCTSECRLLSTNSFSWSGSELEFLIRSPCKR